MKILEEFWYGNVEPTEYNTYFCKDYKKSLGRFVKTMLVVTEKQQYLNI